MNEIPSNLIAVIEHKLEIGIFDIGNVIGLGNDDDGRLVAVTLQDLQPNDIFLIDHMVEFANLNDLRNILENNSNLIDRFNAILLQNNHKIAYVEMYDSCYHNKIQAAQIIEYITPFIGSYFDEETKQKMYYILDEIGLQLLPLLSQNSIQQIKGCKFLKLYL